LATSVQAQEFKAGFVNTDRIFREANTAKTAQAKLEQEFARREKELVDIGQFPEVRHREVRARSAHDG
jgi:outer membrane protein